MKIHQRIEQEARLRGADKDLAARLDLLFAHCPALSGFAVRVENGALLLTDVCISPQLGSAHHNEVFERIAAALAELLRSRTFARTLH